MVIAVTRSTEIARPVDEVLAETGGPIGVLARSRHVLWLAPSALGEPGLGGTWSLVERVGPVRMAVRLHVEREQPGRAVVLRGGNRWLERVDVVVLRGTGEAATRITRHAQFRLRGPARLAAPWARPLLVGLVEDGIAELADVLRAHDRTRTLAAPG